MRIGIVNHTAYAAEALRRAIISHSGHEVSWVAQSGGEAVAHCLKDKPDAVLMDLAMSDMNGVEATRRIMAATPCAIVMVSGNIARDTAMIFDAMGAGALDAVTLPAFERGNGFDGAKALVQKLDKIARLVEPPSARPGSPASIRKDSKLVAIGASAGGPAALVTILEALPTDYAASVVIVQHVDPFFAGGLASWLHQHSPLPVRLAEEGDRLHAGRVYVAAREEHLILTSPNRLGYTRTPPETSYRPSVDVFFKSVDHYWQGDVVAVLLTGMGRDGAEGLRLLRGSGYHTIAQDKSSSAVYGMPKAAADLGAATEILALDNIGPRLANIFSQT
jgi:two-component system response regulator WspF